MSTSVVKPSHRRQQLWVCIIAGLFLCDFILCGYIPSQQRLTTLQQAQAQQQSMVHMAAAQQEELPALKARLRETEEAAERFETHVPVDNALGAFLQRIAAVMTENELSDQSVLPEKELETGDLGCIPIHISCKGTLTNLFSFFNSLQAMDRLVRIKKIAIENEAGFTGRLTLQTDAFIFYQLKPRGTQDAGNPGSARGARNGQ